MLLPLPPEFLTSFVSTPSSSHSFLPLLSCSRQANKSIWFVFAFLIAVLVLTLVVFPAYRMRMTRLFSVVLFTIYAIFLVIIVLVEAKILAN